MCKAKSITEQMLKLWNDAEEEFKRISKEQQKIDMMQQDVLHMIENDKFNAAEGYCYAKKLQEIRQNRRKLKNEMETLLILKTFTSIKGSLEKANEAVVKADKKLTYLHDNKVYKTKVLQEVV